MFNNLFSRGKDLISSNCDCQFPWCKHSQHDQLRTTNLMPLNMVLDRDAYNRLNNSHKPTQTSSNTHRATPTCKHTVICRPLIQRINNKMHVLGGFYFSSCWSLFSTFLKMLLFIYLFTRHTEKGRGRSRLHAGILMWDSIPGPQDHALGQSQALNHLSQGSPRIFLRNI